MAQSQCRGSLGDQFYFHDVVENIESGINPQKKSYKESVVTSREIFYRILTRFDSKFVRSARDQPPTISDTVGGAVICTRASYDSTVRLVGGARRNRTISRPGPPMQSAGATD